MSRPVLKNLYRLTIATSINRQSRCLFHHEFTEPEQKTGIQQQLSTRNKYKIFRDEDTTEIFDLGEERSRYQNQDQQEIEQYLYLTRGVTGVFDIVDLVTLLRKENADDVFVCTVPEELKYVDYMVVCSGRSYRHMLAIATFVRHIYKKKRLSNDLIPKIEGEKSRDWMALDLGNITLHIFSPSARESYDLESLWAIGHKYDKESNKPHEGLIDLFNRNSTLLSEVDLKLK